MHIKEIHIDGFKSYATRTVLNGFDKSFNAITGLNGSGKSNILDAICFVLGISNLGQVRVNNLQELIYKQGQADVTKASVSVVFDNSDKDTSPVGYEDQSTITVYRQIMIGGKNKYMINGRNAQLSRVQNLFHSVQLNVNNPHFLIMQGRITKVLNMKPIEILGMIEEAAGTRMFEVKKGQAQKTIQKKDQKLEEIAKLLSEEIEPKLEKLNADKTKYMKYNEILNEYQNMERYCIAFEYYTAECQLKNLKNEEDSLRKKISELESKHNEFQKKESETQKKIENLKKQRQSDMKDEVKELENKVAKLNKELIHKKSELEHKKEEYEREKAQLDSLQKQIMDEENNKLELEKKCHNAVVRSEELKQKIQDLTNKIDNMKRQKEAVSAGVAVNISDGNGKTITEQVLECKQTITSLKSSLKQSEMRLSHLKTTLNEKKIQLSKQSAEETSLKQQLEEIEKVVNTQAKQLEQLNFNESKYIETEKQIEMLEADIVDRTNKINQKKMSLEQIFLDYNKENVSGNVMGVVANLFRIKDKQNTCALEVAAGPRLGQLVVDTEKTGKEVIEKGNISRRVTVIPLNNITYGKRFENQELLKQVHNNNASLALDLINYESKVENAMKYCFGSTLVATDMETAKKVAFDKTIYARTVTIDGDVFDPSGTLTGGSRHFNPETSILSKLEALKLIEDERDSIIKKVEGLKSQLNKKLKDKYYALKNELRLKKHEQSLAQKRVEQSSYFQTKKQVEEMEQEIVKINENMKQFNIDIQNKQKELVDLEKQQELFSKASDEEAVKKQKLEMIDKNIEKAKKELQTAKTELKEADSDKLSLQLQQMSEDIKEMKTQYESKRTEIESNLEKTFTKLQKDVDNASEAYESESTNLKACRLEFSKSDEEISKLNELKDKYAKNASDILLEVKSVEHTLSNSGKNSGKLATLLNALKSENKWIKNEKENFNKPDTEFHFDKNNQSLQECKQRLSKLKEECDSLSKSINKKAMAMHEKAVEEYNDLVKKREIVQHDRHKIENVIEDLDDKKKKAIEETWKKVNTDFGSIFSTLLNGTTAKLEPPSDAVNGALDGLEVRVAFNGVWKESLTELSGGQRSLLALSLILALLRFKPAPVYILDEIDAALDPSHTQNIGRMLKTHFTNSQFIVVSLKEGMFQNANVLYKTKFVNGSSLVERVVDHRSAVDSDSGSSSNNVNPNSSSTTTSSRRTAASASSNARTNSASVTATTSSQQPAQLVSRRGSKRKSANEDESEEEEE
ncbi:hypothetical protein C9374_000993 [Naegleria lovaniensis]|uniref:Structural maintenance of chromosomes protein n=1 Tax=Naegleria lovaniensis TaxID=51637 RepID=A0AA88GXF8_NAELO|nr:uncharacterized protein C9374_000993 [Naegleria lovaniensis]KAG2388143.1 hypothetical protein C9374_000993 [Naegleria lovaniensis]